MVLYWVVLYVEVETLDTVVFSVAVSFLVVGTSEVACTVFVVVVVSVHVVVEVCLEISIISEEITREDEP